MAKGKKLYSQTPVVPAKQIAGTNPVGVVTLGSGIGPMVPARPASIHGLDVPAHSFRQASIKGAKGYGRVAKLKQGHLRMSGVPGAHRVGAKGK